MSFCPLVCSDMICSVLSERNDAAVCGENCAL